MSKQIGMLDPVIRTLVGVPRDHLGVVADMCNKLKDDGEKWQRILSNVLKDQTLLIPLGVVGVVKVPAQERFSVREYFVSKRKIEQGDPKIIHLWEPFERRFYGLKEDSCAEEEFNVYDLTQTSANLPIIAEIGYLEPSRLSQVFSFLKVQADGCEGPLLVDGSGNIFYVQDTFGYLWGMYLRWWKTKNGWAVEIQPYTKGYACHKGRRVFTPKEVKLNF